MKKIYADTSVIGGCFDMKFKEQSMVLLEVFKTGLTKVIISDLTLLELAPVRQEIKNKINEVPTAYVTQARSNEMVYNLAEAYIKSGVLSNKNYHDAVHIALATVYKADALASWNADHIADVEKAAIYNAINMLMGYDTIHILTPTLILKTINNETSHKLSWC
jgi:predicted nucleic acid-binding protein